MNKTAIKNFAIWAREKLIADITYKAGTLGITENGIAEKLPQSTIDLHFFDINTKDYAEVSGSDIEKRNALAHAIKAKENYVTNYKEAFQYIIEEVAYTWFNRLIAIRFMEVNDYQPSGVRVLSSDISGKNEPDIVTNPFATDIDFSEREKDLVWQLKDENKLDELFRILFIKQCNKLNEVLPNLFEQTNNYTELLLSISFTDTDGVLRHLVNDIAEEDFKDAVQILGWLYQYYNSVPKDIVFANLKKNIKISKENIPAATQLFTPDWIVRYMVENSLGRIAVDKFGIDPVSMGWKYYLPEAEQTEEVQAQFNIINNEKITLEELKVIDPCMGSGHILVYAFDVLVQIYESQGYTARDAVASILGNNLFGLDIDERAYQLAYFALMMKARSYDRRCFSRKDENGKIMIFTPQVYCPKGYEDGEEYGSLLSVDKLEEKPQQFLGQLSFDTVDYKTQLNTWNFRRLLNQKYDVVVTNPPYKKKSDLNPRLAGCLEKKFENAKNDLYSSFIIRCSELANADGYYTMITQQSWIFSTEFEKLRNIILRNCTINLVHLGAKAFEEISGEKVQTVSFVIRNVSQMHYRSRYIKLDVFGNHEQKMIQFHNKDNHYLSSHSTFQIISQKAFAYWISPMMINIAIETKTLNNYADCCTGMQTGNNPKYIRAWSEVSINKTTIVNERASWVKYNCGGESLRWYGNNLNVIYWENNGLLVREEKSSVIRNEKFYYKQGITWKRIAGENVAFRYLGEGFIFDQAGDTMFAKSEENYYYLLALVNSVISKAYLAFIAPTLNLTAGSMKKLPTIIQPSTQDLIENLAKENVMLAKTNWDSFETSWDFIKHPFIVNRDFVNERHTTEDFLPDTKIEDVYAMWQAQTISEFEQLKTNEEELNRIFIDIYGLQHELSPEVEDKDVTVRPADLTRDIKSLISYAVGCMLGRYSLDVDGLAYAGGEFDNSKYTTFIPDADNVIPITDEEYFEDDIVGRFVDFVKVVYGAETLEQNLEFIANALGNKGNTSCEIIRNYFLNGFIKDHIKTYQKRPIYWMFDSGKQNGFKALVYMHRWNADTTGNMRVEYLHRMQKIYEKEIERMQEIIDNSHDNKEVNSAIKNKEKIQKQLKETKDYDTLIAHLALSRIDIDLDDGVKVNYEKVQTATDGKNMNVLVKI